VPGELLLRDGPVVLGAQPTPVRRAPVKAVLHGCPEPTIVCDGAELHSRVRVALHRGARAVLREEVVLGRAGQRGGRFTGELAVELEGTPLLAHTLLLDGADPVLTGPAGTGGARAVGMLTVVGEGIAGPAQGAGEKPGLCWACCALDGPSRLLLALGERPAAVSAFLDEAVG
jgi:urease accessory protein